MIDDDRANPWPHADAAVDRRVIGDRLYYRRFLDDGWDTEYVVEVPVVKITKERVYFERFGSVHWLPRQVLERVGHAYHRLFRVGPVWVERPPDAAGRGRAADAGAVAERRREMAEAHPDRGGTREAFEAARARYLAAKRRRDGR